jgi:hypothetical protein
MHPRTMLRFAGRHTSGALVAWTLLVGGACIACSNGSSGSPAAANGPDDAGGMHLGADDATTGADGQAADGSTANDTGANVHDAGAGQGDGGGAGEGGATGEGGTDGGPRDIGSCCSAQTTPGCGDPNLEVCVCEKDSTCCTVAWGLQCAFIVQQKYCQPGVRDCVCGSDAGQWDQTTCCTTDWNSTCDSVATLKCGAAQGCF